MKRGQITLFIILGIVVLIGASLFFYFKTVKIGDIGERVAAPEEIVPVVEYVETCLSEIGAEALALLGQQGGYIYLPDRIRLNPFAYLQIVKNSPIKLPYWYYKGKSQVPSMAEMEGQISRYVEENLGSCLREFDAMSEQFEVTEAGKIKAITKATATDVVVKLDYKLRIENIARKSTTRFSDYITHLPVRLKHVHELSKDIMLRENAELFFEDFTLNLMVLDPNIPFSDMTLDCSRPRWLVPEVEDSLKETIALNLPRVRLENTNYEPFEEPLENYKKYDKYDNIQLADIENIEIPEDLPPDMYRYKQLFWRGFNKKYNNLEVTFMYDEEWPIEMVVRPSDGNIMRSNTGKGPSKYAAFICLVTYHFTYDVRHPVEAIVSDPASFNGDGYNFHFAFPVLINHNQGDRETFTISDFPIKDSVEGFCDQESDRTIEVRARDHLTQDLEDVKISFECGRFRCELGTTKLDPPGIKLFADLPTSCYPGEIIAEKEGFWTNSIVVPDGDNRVFLTIRPMILLNINLQSVDSFNYDFAKPLKSNQRVMIQVINEELGYAEFRTIPSEKGMPEVMEFPLMDETYDVFIMMFEKNFKGTENIIGGYQGNLTTSEDTLLGSSTITFNVVEHLPSVINNKAELMNMYLEIENPTIKEKFRPVIE